MSGDYYEGDYNDTSTYDSSNTLVDYDLRERIVNIKTVNVTGLQDDMKYIHVPEGVNIFSLLALDQPDNATNISNWKVSISTQHQLFPKISDIIEVSNTKVKYLTSMANSAI